QPQAGALAGRLGREERLEQLVFDLRRNAGAVVTNADFNRIAEFASRHLQRWPELCIAFLPLAFGGRVEAIAEQVETNAGDVLGSKFDWGDHVGKISFRRDVEALILGTGTVIGEI